MVSVVHPQNEYSNRTDASALKPLGLRFLPATMKHQIEHTELMIIGRYYVEVKRKLFSRLHKVELQV